MFESDLDMTLALIVDGYGGGKILTVAMVENYTGTQTEDDQIKLDFQLAKDNFEKEFIVQALKLHMGKINQTALKANIPKKTLLRKIEKYEINPKAYY